MILAGDVGGTKTHLALFQVEAPRRIVRLETFSSRAFESFDQMLDAFLLAGAAPITAATVGIAGPIRRGVALPTNLAWTVDGAHLARRLRLATVGLINDLEATAWGLEALDPDDTTVLLAGAAAAGGNQAVIAAGTGLGEAVLVRDGTRSLPLASEGGHADFAPRTDLEIELLKYLRRRFGRVSWERVLSGPGLLNTYEFLRDTGGEEPQWLAAAIREGDPAAEIANAALAGRSELCTRTLDLFSGAYGAETGNLALRALATGGVFLGGGIAPKIVPLLGASFRKAFLDKGRLSMLVEAAPVKVIRNDKAALLGAARHAAQQLP